MVIVEVKERKIVDIGRSKCGRKNEVRRPGKRMREKLKKNMTRTQKEKNKKNDEETRKSKKRI